MFVINHTTKDIITLPENFEVVKVVKLWLMSQQRWSQNDNIEECLFAPNEIFKLYNFLIL